MFDFEEWILLMSRAPDIGGPSDDALLLEDGTSFLLLEDGTSFLLLG